MSLAACEGVKSKRLIGSLRALWRSSPGKGHNQRVTHLKSILVASPERQRPAAVDAPPADPEPQVSDEDDEEPAADDGSSDESSPPSPNREALVEVGSNVESEHEDSESNPPSPNREALVEVGSNVESEDGESNASSLKAPTLRLDDCREDESEEHPTTQSDSSVTSDEGSHSPVYEDAFEAGDSQVPGSGWMGRAMMNHRKIVEPVDKNKEMKKRDQSVRNYVALIQAGLKEQLGPHCVDGELWDMYADWCSESLRRHGDIVYEQMASAEFFHGWCREQKAQADWGRSVAWVCWLQSLTLSSVLCVLMPKIDRRICPVGQLDIFLSLKWIQY